ncbi:hypothetical protein F5Y16DRAFT_400862 [Xylariaceae sp. FL0255]|nr:hypothetical protein F5Y16DRAFT_400862 [Xylariaceae sp. FL0255]
MQVAQHSIHIIGAGIGGLTLGRCLLKYGIPTVLYEKVPGSSRHGYGITLHASSYRPLLDVLGLDEKILGGVSPWMVEPTSFRAHREKLEQLLRECLEVQWEHALEKVKHTASENVIGPGGGRQLQSAFVVGTDGPHSSTRKSPFSDTHFKVLPYVAFDGKRRISRARFDEVYAPAMGNSAIIETRVGDATLNVSVNDQQDR